ncbi:unnamed protein product (macronuclear) [Paramecium tetraurelia]|uniref:Uncharacterized protein n=3 Tax=Paramecium TaxID=5884 RepID=A0CP30_PARTE|nr:uncharacterized protein GSPATT00008938001 [Paramecium tetraurelia]CAD8136681.1 unnamed protein product [Paramecium octaurelia]CAD8138244.1 unnamed protein product [Paramecium pentaurelia]CAK72547.1 unnamed protein product [Paramecium tetraurelia]|eukprot:XP_001439944.1 hypothetical protein (macronuclear) [Paramecium tetraurelia strain d4-2]
MRLSQQPTISQQTFSFGPANSFIQRAQQTQPIIRVNQPCFRVYTQPMQNKRQSKSPFKRGYDTQEENRTLKMYIQQMEQTLANLQQNNKRLLLQQQLKENSHQRDEIQKLKTEISTELAERAYLEKVCQKL